MNWNNGIERKKFDAQQERLAREYAAAGMSEMQIVAMYTFDLEVYKGERCYALHTQPLDLFGDDFDGFDGESPPLLEKFLDILSVTDSTSSSRFGWLDEIEDEVLVKLLINLSREELDLLTLNIFEEYSQRAIAQMRGCSQSAISQKIGRIKKYLRNF